MLDASRPFVRLILPAQILTKDLASHEGKFKHSGKHYLLNGRWHKINEDQPVPKGAPVAAHPHAAGQHAPAKHFSDEEWAQLKLPAENTNASHFNGQLDHLKQMSEAGHVTGILGHSYGTNTYGKKLAKVANHLLGLHGSQHQVTPGQKAGQHAAVTQAPEPEAKPDTVQSSVQDPVLKPEPEAAVQPETQPADLPGVGTVSDPLPDQSGGGSALSMPAFSGGTVGQSVIDYYQDLANVLIGLAEAGDVEGLEHMKEHGQQPNSKGKVSNTWAGKTPNSKLMLKLHAEALDKAKGGGQAPSTPSLPDGWSGSVGGIATKPGLDGGIVDKNKSTGSPFSGKWFAVAHDLKLSSHFKEKWFDTQAEAFQALADAVKAGPQTKPVLPTQPAPAQPQSTPDTGPLTADQLGKLQSIPWHKLKLPDTNTNAASVNKKLQALQDAAFAGDVAAIQAMKWGQNTYNKKLELAAQTALAALGEATTAKPPEPAPAAPAPAQPATPAPAEPKTVTAPKTTLHNTEPGHSKSWSVHVAPNASGGYDMVTEYGKIGGAQQKTAKSFPTSAAAHAAALKLTNEKKAKGYKHANTDYGHKAEVPGVSNDGFKEGETKITAGGVTYTLQANGDWNTSTGDTIKAKSPFGFGLSMATGGQPDFTGQGNAFRASTAQYAAHAGMDPATALNAAFAGVGENGPDEGDTQTINGVTYQLINGRWHKVSPDDQGQQQAAAPEPEPAVKPAGSLEEAVNNLNEPDWSQDKHSYTKYYAQALTTVKAAVLADGKAGFTKWVISKKDGGFSLKSGLTPGFKFGTVHGQTTQVRRKMLHQALTELKAAVEAAPGAKKKATPKPQAAATPAPSAPVDAIEPMDDWLQVGGQGGSNPGGKFKDKAGQDWYCKFPGDDDIAKSEVLAAKLYGLAGLQSQQAKLITKGGKIGIASKWVEVKKAATPAALAAVAEAQSGFAVDAWLANWDVVGMGYDNLQVGADGKAVRVDAGGSLEYRAQGAKKPFGPVVDEIETLRDAKKNPQAAAVFGKMTQADITASVAKVLAISDTQIRALVAEHGPGDAAAKKALADTLIARKADLTAKYPKAAKQTAKKALDPAALPVKPEDLPKRHDFANWKGPGQGLSSKVHVNAANQAVEDQMYALAKTGNLVDLKKFHYQPLDKETGAPTGNPIPIEKHPSKHVVQLHADLVTTLDEIANPPQPLKIFRETEVNTLDGLAAAFPSKKFGTTVNKVASNEKLGFWVAMGAIKGAAAKFMPKKVQDYSAADIKAAHDRYKLASPLAKAFINGIQASGSYNDLFRNGVDVVPAHKPGAGSKLADVAKAALAFAVGKPEGTSLYRWQNMSDEMVKHIMAAQEGTVFQATGPMCTSYHPTATSGFGSHRVVIRYAKGAKAVESFGSGAFSGEKEVTTLPNARFVILKKEMVEGKSGGKKRLELEVLMLPPDLGL